MKMVGVEQISVFLENKPGRLQNVTRLLGETGVSIRAFVVAEAGEFGMIRVIVDKPVVALETLSARGFVCSKTEVLCVEIPDVPGELSRLSQRLSDANVNIDYAYAFLTSTKKAIIVVKLDETERGMDALEGSYRLIGEEEISKL
jgi:hypothetical protein